MVPTLTPSDPSTEQKCLTQNKALLYNHVSQTRTTLFTPSLNGTLRTIL